MTDEQIKHMVERFLQWKLPENFNPDGGISFKRMRNEHTDFPAKNEPVGTNLLDAEQAETMIRYLVEEMALQNPPDRDVERLDWLAENEANLISHRERMSDGYGIWWNVVKRNKSISGHPLGSPRAAIDFAISMVSARKA